MVKMCYLEFFSEKMYCSFIKNVIELLVNIIFGTISKYVLS